MQLVKPGTNKPNYDVCAVWRPTHISMAADLQLQMTVGFGPPEVNVCLHPNEGVEETEVKGQINLAWLAG